MTKLFEKSQEKSKFTSISNYSNKKSISKENSSAFFYSNSAVDCKVRGYKSLYKQTSTRVIIVDFK